MTMPQLTTAERIKEISNISNLELFYREAERMDVTPGWIKRETPILWREAHSKFVPAQWRYREIKAALDAAAKLIDVASSERRNLVMRNPFPENNFATTNSVVMAYQMILPGEIAPSHRHSSHALRVIVDGVGSYSIVNGEKILMETGDVVLTPGWCWHGHGHEGNAPAYWIDALDVPLTHLLEPMFYEEYPHRYEKIASVPAKTPFRYARHSLMMALDNASPHPDGFHGPRVHLEAPDIPVMSLSMERLDSGFTTRPQRSTANNIFVIVEGQGETIVGDRTFKWEAGDTLAVPCWNKYSHKAGADTVLFTVSDESLMRFSGYYRFEAD
jgi:gentisate 1,2-dioxygenase